MALRSPAFAAPILVSKRPRSLSISTGSSLRRLCLCKRYRHALRLAPDPFHATPPPRMSADDSIVRSAPDNKDHVGAPGFIPAGAFTICLKVKTRQVVSVADAKAVLAEYARSTCSEPGVLRCDVLYQVTSLGTPTGRYYHIWIAFEDAAAYTAHEKTTHAARLRLWLENPAGGDCAVALTKLSYQSSILEALRPSAEGWRSVIDYTVETDDERNQRMADATMNLIRGDSPTASNNVRKSLDVLVSSVGLENVTVLVASATAVSSDAVPSLTGICEQYAEDLEKSVSIVRTGILAERNNAQRIVVITVHDSKREEGAFFDTDMAADLIDDDGWSVSRYFPVFPDKIGWEKPSTLLDQEEEPAGDESLSFLGPVGEAPEGVVITAPSSAPLSIPTSDCRLLQGAGAFDELKKVIREITGKEEGEIKSMIICGWNAGRVQPLLVQLQLVKEKDPGVISFKFGLSVEDCDASIERLKKGTAFIKEHEPDVILGYGGGAVMDMTKALGLLGNASLDEIDESVRQINAAADTCMPRVRVSVSTRPIPVVLIPTTIGAGAELTDLCVIKANLATGAPRRICVDFGSESNVLRIANDRVILSDSRLIGPRILYGIHAAHGALMLICRGIDVLLSLYDQAGHQGVKQAEEAVAGTSEIVMDVYREPRKASGQTRDPLAYAQTKMGLAADCAGKLGLVAKLSLAAVDEIIDELYPRCFRTIFIRVTAALLTKIISLEKDEACRKFADHVAKAMLVRTPQEAVQRLLRRAEDVDVPLLSRLGLLHRTVPSAAGHAVKAILLEPELSSLEHRLADETLLQDVLHDAIDQDYEL